MAQNISKYVQLNDFVLLEYEFNRDGATLDISDSGIGAAIATTDLGTKQFYNTQPGALGSTNNILELNAIPINSSRSQWLNNYTDISNYNLYFDSVDVSVGNITNEYKFDNIKLHIISGYNFDDVTGFILQVRAEDSSNNMVDLSNFSYLKQPDVLNSADVIKFNANTLYLGNRFYDKYIEFKVPSVQELGEDTAGGFDSSLGQALSIKQLSDVYLSYSTIPTIQSDIDNNNTFGLFEDLKVQLPVISNADNFNAFISESTSGDFIEFYSTWNDQIIGQYMGDIESGRIPLYTSNNPNDNYEEFSAIYGVDAKKWVIMHEIFVYEQIPNDLGGTSLLTQKYVFTQDSDFSLPNYFRPVLKNSDIAVSYSIQYVCRLSNRMDGSQIIRRASLASQDPKKYGLKFARLNVENLIPYKIFNKIEAEKANILTGDLKPKSKYIKVYFDTTKVIFNKENEVYPQGAGPLFLKNGDSLYKFKFEKINELNNQRENVDLSGAYQYNLLFILDDGTKIEAPVSYSNNMNTTIGEIDFKLFSDQIVTLLNQTNNNYSVIIKNPDNSEYTFYQGSYYSYKNKDTILSSTEQTTITSLNTELLTLKSENADLLNKIANLTSPGTNNTTSGLQTSL